MCFYIRCAAVGRRAVVAPRARDVVGGGDLVLWQAGHLASEGRDVVDEGLCLVVVSVLWPFHLAEQRVAVLAPRDEAVGYDGVGGRRVDGRPAGLGL